MKTNSVLCKADIKSMARIHVKYHVTDSKIYTFVFWNHLENAEGFTGGLTDEQATTILTSENLSLLDFGQIFSAEQLSINRPNSYWQISDRRVFDLNDTLYSSSEVEPPVMWTFIVDFQGKIKGPYNKYVESFNRKSWTARDANLEGAIVLLTVYSKDYKPTSFSQCRVALSYSEGTFFDCNVPAVDITSYTDAQRTADLYSYQPQITFAGNNQIQAGNTQTLTITLTDPETNTALADYTANVYIQNTGGYVNKQRVLVTPGGANVVVRALDLEPGDEFKVKAGWRNYSGVTEIKYTVV